MEDDRELAGTEVGSEVTPDLADHVDDQLAHLLRDLRQLLVGERVQVRGPLDPRQQRVGAGGAVSGIVFAHE